MKHGEFEDEVVLSSDPEHGSTSAFVALVACTVMLLLMVAA